MIKKTFINLLIFLSIAAIYNATAADCIFEGRHYDTPQDVQVQFQVKDEIRNIVDRTLLEAQQFFLDNNKKMVNGQIPLEEKKELSNQFKCYKDKILFFYEQYLKEGDSIPNDPALIYLNSVIKRIETQVLDWEMKIIAISISNL
jgi:hypothetical protein